MFKQQASLTCLLVSAITNKKFPLSKILKPKPQIDIDAEEEVKELEDFFNG